MYALKIEKKAVKFLNKLSAKDQDSVFIKLEALSSNPYRNNLDIKKLKGGSGNEYRLRVRDFRLIYKIYNQELIIIIIDANYRKDSYKRL